MAIIPKLKICTIVTLCLCIVEIFLQLIAPAQANENAGTSQQEVIPPLPTPLQNAIASSTTRDLTQDSKELDDPSSIEAAGTGTTTSGAVMKMHKKKKKTARKKPIPPPSMTGYPLISRKTRSINAASGANRLLKKKSTSVISSWTGFPLITRMTASRKIVDGTNGGVESRATASGPSKKNTAKKKKTVKKKKAKKKNAVAPEAHKVKMINSAKKVADTTPPAPGPPK